MFISHNTNVASGFLRWSDSLPKKNSNDNDQPGGSTPVSLDDPLTSDPDASPAISMALKRTGSA